MAKKPMVVAQRANVALTPERVDAQAERLRGAAMVQREIPLETD